MRISDPAAFAHFAIPHAQRHLSRAQRHLSRRQLLRAGVATGAVVAASSVFAPMRAAAAAPGPGTPTPVAGDPTLFGLHIWVPELGKEPSAITDFNGAVGVAIVDGTGVGTTASGTEALLFDTDMRFMQGVFRGTDGRVHQGTFAFI